MGKLWKKWSEEGLRLPFLYDPVSKKPSVTILFPYAAFVLVVISIILLHIWSKLIIATITTFIFWASSVVFYLIRKINKAKFGVKEGKFELESGEKDVKESE